MTHRTERDEFTDSLLDEHENHSIQDEDLGRKTNVKG
jgi:hypothetical protein